eukprot:TRINITY_DN13633_c0_g2_i1.p1 TRINITY_DN13633_c0_g2~~TRINITY_DN13633_c0_g2_i1.p1  ORF type:complete len:593 (-),score=90.86 TRINITY_DN13633_c0_g2_i1:520-2121(-)
MVEAGDVGSKESEEGQGVDKGAIVVKKEPLEIVEVEPGLPVLIADPVIDAKEEQEGSKGKKSDKAEGEAGAAMEVTVKQENETSGGVTDEAMEGGEEPQSRGDFPCGEALPCAKVGNNDEAGGPIEMEHVAANGELGTGRGTVTCASPVPRIVLESKPTVGASPLRGNECSAATNAKALNTTVEEKTDGMVTQEETIKRFPASSPRKLVKANSSRGRDTDRSPEGLVGEGVYCENSGESGPALIVSAPKSNACPDDSLGVKLGLTISGQHTQGTSLSTERFANGETSIGKVGVPPIEESACVNGSLKGDSLLLSGAEVKAVDTCVDQRRGERQNRASGADGSLHGHVLDESEEVSDDVVAIPISHTPPPSLVGQISKEAALDGKVGDKPLQSEGIGNCVGHERRESTRPCHYYMRGNCRKGKRCQFLHIEKANGRDADPCRSKQGDGKNKLIEELNKDGSGRAHQQPDSSQRRREPSLLEKLLEKDIRQERSHLLQAFRFLARNDFLVSQPFKELKFPEGAPEGETANGSIPR